MSKIVTNTEELIKHTSAIHVSNTITIIERKISNILLKNSFSDLIQKDKYSIYIKDIINLLGWNSDNNYEVIKSALKKLNTTQLEWNILNKDKKNEWGITTIISGAKIKNGICEYSYSPTLRELLAIPNIYAKLNMAIQAKFNSKYSLVLWEFLIEALCSANKDIIITNFIELKNIRKLLGIEEIGIYEEFKILNRDVLKKATTEINLISDIEVECFPKKDGKKITAIKFKILRKKNFDYPLLNYQLNSIEEKSTIERTNLFKERNSLIEILINEFNFSLKKSTEIIDFYSSEKINQTIEYVKIQINNNNLIKNKTAYFISSLKENWTIESKNNTEDNKILEPDIIEQIETNDPIWAGILKYLLNSHGLNTYISWFSKLKFIHYNINQKSLNLKVDTKFYKNWINNNYKNDILKAAQSIKKDIQDVEIDV